MVVSLFYYIGLGGYISSTGTQNPHLTATASVMYTVVSPMQNPFIYSLRNKDIKRALKRLFERKSLKVLIVCGRENFC
jgi:olfactory receptor